MALALSLSSIKILYNNCYGGFMFSTAFEDEYKSRTGKDFLYSGPGLDRCDPVAIAIFEEKGSEWSSGTHSMLDIREIPAIFERYWEIDEFDGNETVRICISEAYADILHTYMEHGSLEDLRTQYAALKEAFQNSFTIYREDAHPKESEIQNGNAQGNADIQTA
jgi:hypothetical protein